MIQGANFGRARRLPLMAACLLAIAGAGSAAPPPASATAAPNAAVPASGPGSLSGVWMNDEYQTSGIVGPRAGVLMTSDGKRPPLRPEASALLEKRIQDAEAGRPYETTMSQCLPAGFPNMMFGPRLPLQIIETPGQVTILIEPLANFRIIRLDEKHQEDPDPTFFGDSVGRWEGDTLVVDTIALNERTTLDPTGMPHSEQLHIVERFRRASKDRLDLTMTIEDPKTFTRSWTAKTSFTTSPDLRISEYFCENNRNEAGGKITGLSSDDKE